MLESLAPDSLVVFDAASYRALVKERDMDGARAAAQSLADAERARGFRAVASPFALWSLLADVAGVVAPQGERAGRSARGPSEAEHARAARARLALAACAVHCARDRSTPGPHPFILADDPESLLCRALGVQPPPGLAAWNEYLASVATEIAAEPTVERAQRLAGPLGHVAERARATAEDYVDEMQDAVLAAYDAASAGWGWDADTSDGVRQRDLTGGALMVGGETPVGEPFIFDLLRRDPLLRAIAAGRAGRAHTIAARAASPNSDPGEIDVEPTVDEVARVAESFPAGVALGREVLRRIIAGDVEMAGRAARRWLWDLHVAYGLGQARGVVGGSVLSEAAHGIAGLETFESHASRAK